MLTIEKRASVDALYKDGISIFSKEKKSLYFLNREESFYFLDREGNLYYRSIGENLSVRSMKKQFLDPFLYRRESPYLLGKIEREEVSLSLR